MNQEPKTNIKNIENPDKISKKKAVNNENNLINKLFIQMKNYSLVLNVGNLEAPLIVLPMK